MPRWCSSKILVGPQLTVIGWEYQLTSQAHASLQTHSTAKVYTLLFAVLQGHGDRGIRCDAVQK